MGEDSGADGAAVQRSVVLLLDASASMRGPAPGGRIIDLLNDRIRDWLPRVRQEAAGRLRGTHFAVVAFGGRGVRVLTDPGERDGGGPTDPGRAFVPAADLEFGPIEASGTTPMVRALNLAADLCEARCAPGAPHPVPVRIVLLSHGGPNDRDLPRDAWRAASARIAGLCGAGRAQFAVFGLPGAGEHVLRAMAGAGRYCRLDDLDFAGFLDLVLDAGAQDDQLAAIRARFRPSWEGAG